MIFDGVAMSLPQFGGGLKGKEGRREFEQQKYKYKETKAEDW